MIIEDIKKLLYKEKPIADLCHETKYFKYYETEVGNNLFIFRISVEEAVNFERQIPAQLLIRWLYQFKDL